MRIISLMHVAFEDAANLGVWAEERGHTVEAVHLYAGQIPPELCKTDAVFVMGGPMNIYEEAAHPWLAAEKQFIKSCIEQRKLVVGVCLGGQLIADVLGGKVTRNAHKEIGWYEVRRTAPPTGPADGMLPERFWAFHWHGDTFSIPPGAVHIASSQACPNQAFLYDGRVLGLQFHLEYSQDSIEAMLVHCADELAGGRFVQSAEQIRQGYRYLPQIQTLLWTMLDRLFQ